jgi:hypothetical protein
LQAYPLKAWAFNQTLKLRLAAPKNRYLVNLTIRSALAAGETAGVPMPVASIVRDRGAMGKTIHKSGLKYSVKVTKERMECFAGGWGRGQSARMLTGNSSSMSYRAPLDDMFLQHLEHCARRILWLDARMRETRRYPGEKSSCDRIFTGYRDGCQAS